MRLSVVAACLSLCLIGFSSAQDAHASIRKETNIPAEGLGPALNALAKERNFQVVYVTEEIANVHTEGAIGVFTTDEALKRLLIGTGLTFRYLDDKTITIGSATAPHTSRSSPTTSTGSEDPSTQEGKKSSSPEFRVAQVDQGKNSSASSIGNRSSSSQENSNSTVPGLTEIIVTAQKRAERLQDVPVPVTALSADSLVASDQLRLEDYYTSVPGLGLASSDRNGNPLIAIRGITTGAYTNPTVAVVVDDVPYGASTSLGGGTVMPDIDPSDLARVEVLRGPQGTLYGANSIGGLIKYVTVDPSTDGVTGRVQAGTSRVYNGPEVGYNFSGSVNVPLGDTLAVRVSGFTRRDPGYIDNLDTAQRGVNDADISGGRVSALWRPSEAISLKLGALLQDFSVHGINQSDPSLGNLKQAVLPGTGASYRQSQVYSAIFNAKLGGVDLTAISGYSINTMHDSFDFTPILGGLTPYWFGPTATGITGTPATEHNQTKKFTQEIRASIAIGPRIEWLVGAFYDHERSPYDQNLHAANPTTGVITSLIGDFNWTATYSEYAAFTDLTLHVTDRFDVQLGGRESHNRQTYTELDTGVYASVFYGLSPFFFPLVVSNENAGTYLVTPRFKISPDLMVYARLASGYRPGGPNSEAAVYGLPLTFGSDKTQNYEIGTKGDFLDHTFSFDASLYYINWKNIQLSLTNPYGNEYIANGSEAKSQGAELSVESKPATGLTIGAWVAWNDSELTKPFPPTSAAYGVPGNRLPYSSRFSGSVSLEQDFPLTGRLSGFVGGALSYVGDRVGIFTSPPPAIPPRQIFPAYAKTDLRAGAKYESWTVNFFVNNVADKRAVLSGGIGNAINPAAFQYIQPRLVGLNVVKTF